MTPTLLLWTSKLEKSSTTNPLAKQTPFARPSTGQWAADNKPIWIIVRGKLRKPGVCAAHRARLIDLGSVCASPSTARIRHCSPPGLPGKINSFMTRSRNFSRAAEQSARRDKICRVLRARRACLSLTGACRAHCSDYFEGAAGAATMGVCARARAPWISWIITSERRGWWLYA